MKLTSSIHRGRKRKFVEAMALGRGEQGREEAGRWIGRAEAGNKWWKVCVSPLNKA